MKTYLYKRPSNLLYSVDNPDNSNAIIFEWVSNEFTAFNVYPKVYDKRVSPDKEYPFSTTMTLIVEAGFNYYLTRLFYEGSESGGSLFVLGSYYGDDYNDFNKAYGAGQTFKLLSGANTSASDYLPKTYAPEPLVPGTVGQLGGVKPRRGVAIDATTGDLDAIPLSSDLITNMNTSHFTNNTGTNKIDISSSYVAPNATKLVNIRNIAGVGFDGSASIDIPYGNLTSVPATWADSQIPSLAISKITNLQTTLDGKAPTSHTHAIGDITNLQTSLDGKAPTSHTHTIANITNLQTTLDGKAPTSHTHVIGDITNLQTTLDAKQATLTSLNTIGVFNGTQFTNNVGTSKIDIASGYKPSSATTADTATKLVNIRNIAGVGFDGSAAIDIPYFNLINKIAVGNGLAITTGSATASPSITLNLSASGDIAINTAVNPATIGVSYTSANLIGAFNTTDFVNTASKITLSNNTSNYVARINTELTTALAGKQATLTSTSLATLLNTTTDFVVNGAKIDLSQNTSNYVARINTQLATAMGTLQPMISSTAGQIIIGNGDGITTTSTGLTWATNTLNATNLAVSTKATITQLLTATGVDVDMFELRNNATNTLRFIQSWIGANDMKWLVYQKSNNVDYPLFNFRNGKIAIGTNSNPAYMVEVVGDINLTGEFRKNGTILKPAGAVLADTATALATSRNIAGVAFNGTADIAIDYFALNNKPIILQPTTTNLQLVSGYTFAVPGNVGVGTTAIATNVLQVGAGGRLRISNGTTDYSLIGTIDTDGATNTSIIISGTTRATNTGNIQYIATASGGSHIFYTASTTTRMTITSSGVNINDNLGVSGRVGIATAPHATYKLDVLGDINCSGAFRVAGTAIANSWSAGTPTTNIYYNLGNVGIGTTNPRARLDLATPDNSVSATSLLDFRNISDYGIYATSISIGSRGNTLDFLARDYNLGAGVATRNVLSLRPDGNVGINNTNPTCKLHIVNSSTALNPDSGITGIYVYNPTNSSGQNSVITNRIGGSSAGRVMYSMDVNGAYGTCMKMEGSSHAIRFNNNWEGTGTDLLTLYGGGGAVFSNYIEANATILSKIGVYARNSYDAYMVCNGSGMFLNFGTVNTGNNDYLEISASGGATNINSNSSRAIYLRQYGYTTSFIAGFTQNGANSLYWNTISDHRVKENIKKSNLQTCYNNVKNINLYRYNYINGFNDKIKDKTQLGFIAQQVYQHFPKSVSREKIRIEDKREIPDLANIDVAQVNFTLFGAVKQLMKVVEKQSKRIKKLEEMLGIIDDDVVDNDADEPYERIVCDEVDIDDIEPSEPVGV
jgi:hypothetical protein